MIEKVMEKVCVLKIVQALAVRGYRANRRFLMVGMMFGMTACSHPQQEAEASPADRAAAKQAYFRCLSDNASLFDDGKSDAATVGTGVRAACHKDFMNSVSLELRGKSTDFASGFLESAPKAETDMATTAVLRFRKGAASR